MNSRIKEIIQYKTGGDNVEFARITGFTPATINKVRRNSTNNIAIVQGILKALPEIDARWLILGEGTMIRPFGLALSHTLFLESIEKVWRLAVLMPKMSAEQVRRFQIAVAKGEFPQFSQLEIDELSKK